ncbi:hypothetical protein ACWER9_06715 [Micromonospora sp. NPDC003944]
MTGTTQVLYVLLALVLVFGTAAIVFASLWARAHDRRIQATTTDPARPDGTADRAAVIAQAVDDLASCLAAERYGLGPTEVERLYAQLYAGLSTLTHGQLVSALADALEADADERRRVLVNQFRTLPTREN